MGVTPVDVASLPAMDHVGRIERLRAAMSTHDPGIDALVVTNPVHLRYLFGFTGSAGTGWVSSGQAVLATDSRYELQGPAEITSAGVAELVEVHITRSHHEVLPYTAGQRLGLEADHVSWSKMTDFASTWFADAELVATTNLVEGLRAVKDAGELARIEAAAAAGDAAFEVAVSMLAQSPTETDVAHAMDAEMRRVGALGPAYETIVATGLNGANPHASPGARPILAGDLVVIDAGALVDGYRSDMTRTFHIGEPDAQAQRMLDVVTAAQAAGVAAVADGIAVAEIDAVCRGAIDDAGWAEAFGHGTGHGVGLDIHEAPMVNGRSDATLRSGHVITVEPGVYLPERGGVRVEDTVVVTEGGARTLTKAPKSPVVG
jgi:Xaa-Pro aminopeptidase